LAQSADLPSVLSFLAENRNKAPCDFIQLIVLSIKIVIS
jgi:hypothetical protein